MNKIAGSISRLAIVLYSLAGCRSDSNMIRIEMFQNRVMFSEDIDRYEFKDDYEKKFYKEKRKVYARICFEGRYNLRGTDRLYVSPEEAKRLLTAYGWKENQIGE